MTPLSSGFSTIASSVAWRSSSRFSRAKKWRNLSHRCRRSWHREDDMAVSEVKTFCRVCTAACGIVVDVDGDQVLRVRGDTDHPLSRGYSCSKGRALPQAHHHPDRIE